MELYCGNARLDGIARTGVPMSRRGTWKSATLASQLVVLILVLVVLLPPSALCGGSHNGLSRQSDSQNGLIRDAEISNELEKEVAENLPSSSPAVPLVPSSSVTFACRSENELMLRNNADWRGASRLFERDVLPLCLDAWARQVLPPGSTAFPKMECSVTSHWKKACHDADGMVATVTASASFAKSAWPGVPREVSIPTCFSTAKVCTSSRYASDYLWAERLNLVSSWCANRTVPTLQCSNVQISSNFWTIYNLPKVIRIVVGILATAVALVIILVIFCWCRKKRKEEHKQALQRALLLRAARRSAHSHSRQTSSCPSDTDSVSESTYDHTLNSSSATSPLLGKMEQ